MFNDDRDPKDKVHGLRWPKIENDIYGLGWQKNDPLEEHISWIRIPRLKINLTKSFKHVLVNNTNCQIP